MEANCTGPSLLVFPGLGQTYVAEVNMLITTL
jgi:hypothetical protein